MYMMLVGMKIENFKFESWILESFFLFAGYCSNFGKFGGYLILFVIEGSYYGYLKYIFTLWYFIKIVTFDFVEDIN